MNTEQKPGADGSFSRTRGAVLGAGFGIVVGAALGNPGAGMVLGAALGLALGPALVRKFEKSKRL
jgi:hypothetical protein